MAESRASIVINAVDNTKVAIQSAKSGLNSLSSAAGSVNSVLGGLGLALGTGSLIAAVKNTADFADEMGKAAQKVGTTTEALSGLKYAGDLADVSFEQLQVGMGKLAKSAEDFRDGSKSAVDAFGKIGLDPTKYKDTVELFTAVVDRLSKMEDGARKTAIAQDILGKSGKELIPLINAGAEGLKAAAEEAKRFGIIVTSEAAKAAEDFNDNITRLNTAFDGLKISIGNSALPAIADLTQEFVDLIQVSDGFYAGFLAFFENKNASQGIADAEQRLASLKKMREGLDPSKSFTNKLNDIVFGDVGDLDRQIAVAEKEFNTYTRLADIQRARAEADAKRNAKGGASGTVTPAVIADVTKKTTGKSDVQKYSEDVASLMQSFQQASTPAQTLSEKLQAQLDLYAALDPGVKTYLQSLVDQAKATEDLAASIELNNSIMEITQQYDDAAAENARAVADSYNAILRETEDLNTALIKDDKKRAQAQLEIEHNRRVERIAMMEAEQDDIDLLLEAENDRFAAAQRSIANETTKTKGIMKDLGMTFTSAFENAIVEGKKLSDVFKGLEQDILRMLARKTVTEPLLDGIGGLLNGFDFGSIFDIKSFIPGMTANANGGTYSGPGISAYSGTVVSKPTIFPFANGTGLMGEAGAEGIFPLKRGKDGKLGVSADGVGGAGANVTVNIIGAPQQPKVQQRNDGNGNLSIDVIFDSIKSALTKDIRSEGPFAQTMQAQYGLNRAAGAR